MLAVKDTQINKALEVLVKEESKYGNFKKSAVIIKIERLENGYEIRMGTLYKESISLYLSEKKDKPFGYFEFEDVTFVVFGEGENTFFEKTANKKNIPFLEVRPKLKTRKRGIPPPPVIYEPVIWIYTYENGKLELIDKGRFTLLT